jgi:hypothetical protein
MDGRHIQYLFYFYFYLFFFFINGDVALVQVLRAGQFPRGTWPHISNKKKCLFEMCGWTVQFNMGLYKKKKKNGWTVMLALSLELSLCPL